MQGTPQPGAPRRRDEALAFIIEHIVRHGFSPTYDEIGRGLGGISSPRVRELVNQLIREGRLAKTRGLQRNLRVLDVAGGREQVVEAMRRLGWKAADPASPFPEEKLARVPRLLQRPAADPGTSTP